MKLFQRNRKTTKADRQGRRKAKKADRSLKRLEKKYNRQHRRADNLNDRFSTTKDKITALGGDISTIEQDYQDGNGKFGLAGLFLRKKGKKTAFSKSSTVPEVEEVQEITREEVPKKSNIGVIALIIAGAKLFKLF